MTIKKKKFLTITLFSVIVFISSFIIVPSMVSAQNAICLYQKRHDTVIKAAIHVVNGKPAVDIFRSQTGFSKIVTGIFGGNSDEITKTITSIVIDDVDSSEKFFGENCPNYSFCEDANKIWLIPSGGNCTIGLAFTEFDFISEMNESSVSSIDSATAYSFNGNGGNVQYQSLLGSCPSNVGFVKLFGTGYKILKIAAPIILVVFASIDIAKAVVSSDEGKMKKAQQSALRRVFAAVIIFLSFAIVEMIINLTSNGSEIMDCVNQILK